MSYSDLFTIYEMVEPPKGYKESQNTQIPEITEQSVFDYPFFENQDSGTIDEFSGLSNPFENQTSQDNSFTFTDYTRREVPKPTLLSLDIEDLFKQEGITSVNGKKIKFGSKDLRPKDSKIGVANSHHKEQDPHTGNANARDISIVNGTLDDYAKLREILLNNPTVRNWMSQKGWGILNELTSTMLKRTNGTGLHFHFGPDSAAVRTWNKWLENPNLNITTIV